MDKVLQDARLHPKVREMAIALQNVMRSKGITILFTQGFRSHEYQDSLYALGRTKSGQIVTNCQGGFSPHNYGLAVDFVPLVPNGKGKTKAAWDRNDLFIKVGQEAMKMGFSWGGSWKKFVDKPHLEKNFGFTITTLRDGGRPLGTPANV